MPKSKKEIQLDIIKATLPEMQGVREDIDLAIAKGTIQIYQKALAISGGSEELAREAAREFRDFITKELGLEEGLE